MMYSKDSANFFAVTTGTLISEMMENNGLSNHDAASKIQMSDDEFEELPEGEIPVTAEIADKLSKVFRISADTILKFESRYRKDLENVNQENAEFILEPA